MRLIDADSLLQWFTDADNEEYSYGEIKVAIQEEPTVPQWIPVTERTPTEDGEYITTVENGEGMFTTSLDWRQDWKEWGFLSYYGESDEPAWRRVTNVVAWMPLPEPYKEG